MNALLRLIHRLPIRSRLFYGYGLTFLAATLLGHAILYSVAQSTIEENIESELRNTNQSIMNMVRTAADASIRNHLRAVAGENPEIVHHFHSRFLAGELKESEAKAEAAPMRSAPPFGAI